MVLSQFYRSKAWTQLAALIKQQRVDDNGFVVCEHCGKPIMRGYDCIAHHRVPITDISCNDASIALNPNNIALLHRGCHNVIHKDDDSRRQNGAHNFHGSRHVYLIYGPPLAGKTSYVRDVMQPGDLVCDIDRIWDCISFQGMHEKPPRLKQNVFTLRDALYDMIQHRVGKWQTAYIIGGFPFSGERERLCEQLQAEPVLINTSKAECLHRLEVDPGGRDPEKWRYFIEEWFKRAGITDTNAANCPDTTPRGAL